MIIYDKASLAAFGVDMSYGIGSVSRPNIPLVNRIIDVFLEKLETKNFKVDKTEYEKITTKWFFPNIVEKITDYTIHMEQKLDLVDDCGIWVLPPMTEHVGRIEHYLYLAFGRAYHVDSTVSVCLINKKLYVSMSLKPMEKK